MSELETESSEYIEIEHGELIQNSLIAFMSESNAYLIESSAAVNQSYNMTLGAENEVSLFDVQTRFLALSGFLNKTSKIISPITVNLKMKRLLIKLVELKLIDKLPTSAFINTDVAKQVTVFSYNLNKDGFETAFKIQEHRDNTERLKQQTSISKTLKDNSSKALATSRLAIALSAVIVIIALHRIGIADDNLKVSQDNLKIAEKRLSLLENKLLLEKK